MNFDLSEEQAMLRDAAARFVREQHGFEHRRELLASREAGKPHHWSRFAEFGWLGLDVAEEFGGLGCSMVETAVLAEQLGAGLVTDPVVASAVLATRLIGASGNVAHCGRWLPQLAQGAAIFTLAHDEPAGKTSDGLPATSAVRHADGYRLSGFKTLVVAGAVADRLIVSARLKSGEVEELALFVVDPSATGLGVDPYRLLDGRDCADVILDSVHCAGSDLLVSGDVAQDALESALDHARVATMAEAVGGIEACLDLTSDYIKARSQFGQTLSRFQALQHLMAEMFVDAQDARSILYRALAYLDADVAPRRRAVAAAQLVIGRAGRQVAAKSVQMHGGYGVTDEYLISHHFKQLLVLEKLYGDAQSALERMAWID